MFVGFIGVPGVGKSALASALARQINAGLFIEPGEECWPIMHDKSWQQQVVVLETWIRNTNYNHFLQARKLADAGKYTVADGGIFLINRELIFAPACDWYFRWITESENRSCMKWLQLIGSAPLSLM